MIRFVLSVGLVAAICAGILFLPVDVPYTVSGNGIVMPAQEWLIVRDAGGSIGTMLRDHLDGTVRSADLHRFERGDVVRYRLHPSIGARTPISEGDTILTIRSNETERRIAALSGDVASAESTVSLQTSGEKEPVVVRAERNLARVMEELAQARREVNRLAPLAERRVVAQQELDLAQSRVQVLEAEVEMARAELEMVRTGARDEQVDVARSIAAARRQELEALSERRDMLTVRTPIGGVVVRSYGADTLLTVRDTSSAVAVVPIPVTDARYVRVGQPVTLDMQDMSVRLEGRLVRIDETVRRLQGSQVVMAVVRVDSPVRDTIVGGIVRCTISADSVRLLEYARRKVQ
ncbi:MAG: HlyD family efflux transporter periplasmic adaptor subunit [Rhodothermales bacterium]